jgi:hypothetical protein
MVNSLIAVLLLFYLITVSGFTENLLSKQLRTFFSENRAAQHLIGFTTLLTLIMVLGTTMSIEKGILFAIIGYAWFIFSTKLDIQWSMMIILLLLFGFIYESKLDENQQIVEKDTALTAEEKQSKVDSYHTQRLVIVGGIILVTVVGAFLYIGKKDVQYGGGFDIMKFVFY